MVTTDPICPAATVMRTRCPFCCMSTLLARPLGSKAGFRDVNASYTRLTAAVFTRKGRVWRTDPNADGPLPEASGGVFRAQNPHSSPTRFHDDPQKGIEGICFGGVELGSVPIHLRGGHLVLDYACHPLPHRPRSYRGLQRSRWGTICGGRDCSAP